MADSERDPKVSSRYGELPREEPSASVDAAILAAARRAAQTRPAPLVPPTGRQRWHFPLAAAAVIVLAVGVALQVERQQPDPELAAVPAQEVKQQDQAKKPGEAEPQKAPPVAKREATPPQPMPAPKREAARERASAEIAQERRDSADTVAAVASRSAPPAPAARAEVQSRMLAKVQSPEQELERIAALRHDGRHEEADQALKEFRKRYPDFKISEEMLKRVEKSVPDPDF